MVSRLSLRALDRRFRETRALARAFQYPHQPVVAQIVPIRRCNLSCIYCNEFDHVSGPVAYPDLERRIDRLAQLGTGIITLSGGEPLLHPDVEAIIRHIRGRGAIATLITNGYLLTPPLIDGLNHAGLDSLQISIDNVVPDEVSKKSLKVLDQKLRWLAELAWFDVTVNAVTGGGIRNPEDALTIATRARDLGFQCTIGIIHDTGGQLKPLGGREREVLDQVTSLKRPLLSFDRYNRFQDVLARGRPYRVALPGGEPLPVYLRRRAGALLFATAWPARDSARGLHDRALAAGVPLRQAVRPLLHDRLRAPRGDDRRSA